jgi:hypothetical protein
MEGTKQYFSVSNPGYQSYSFHLSISRDYSLFELQYRLAFRYRETGRM